MQLITTSRASHSFGGPMESAACSPVSPSSSKAEKDVAPFLKNLRKMLDFESDAVLRWTPNGRAFEIHDMEQMMDYVLPKYFKHRKYTSFQRQLNYFNFRKWTKSKAVVCTFSNEFFLRDQPELAWRITRKKSLHHSHHHAHMAHAALSPPQQHTASQQLHKFVPKPHRPSRVLTMPQQQQHAHTQALVNGLPRPSHQVVSHPFWLKSEGVVISVPRPGSLSDASGRMPFPSPTDQDMMLKEHDHAATGRRHYLNHAAAYSTATQTQTQIQTQMQHTHASHHHQQQQQSQQQHPEPMDWIDCLLPPVDRIEDEIYTYMYPSASSAVSKSSSYEFVSSAM